MAVTAAAAAVAVGATVATTVAANAASEDDRRRAKKLRQEALAAWNKVQPQDYSEVRELVSGLAEENLINPKEELSILQLDSEGRAAVGDPQAIDAQADALEYLQSVMDTEGMTPQDQAYYYEISDRLDRDAKVANQNIMANLQQRGMAGAGQELAMKMQASQDATQRASRKGLDLAAMAMQRKDEAARQSGDMAMRMREQQFGEARAQDLMRLGAAQQNYNIGRSAAQFDYDTRQSEFQQQATQAAGKTGQLNEMAMASEREGQREANQWANIGQGITTAAGAVGQYGMQQDYMDRAFPESTSEGGESDSSSLSGLTPRYAGLFADPDDIWGDE